MNPSGADTVRQCLLVLGMHRSGTSAFAGLMNQLGVSLPNSEILPASGSNLRGHFEPKEVVDLHDRLFGETGSGWFDPRSFADQGADNQILAPYRAELEKFVSAMLAHDGRIVVKDPRICRLVPLWRSILDGADCETIPLLIMRNPIGVANSLSSRNGLSAGVSFPLWLRHVIDAEVETRGMRRAFLRFENLIADWRGEVIRLSDQVGIDLKLPEGSAGDEDFVERSEMHHFHSDDEVADYPGAPEAITQMAVRVIGAYGRLCADPHDSVAMAEIDDVRSSFDDVTASCGKVMFDFAQEVMALSHNVRQLEQRAERAEERLRRMEDTVSWRVTAPLRKLGSVS